MAGTAIGEGWGARRHATTMRAPSRGLSACPPPCVRARPPADRRSIPVRIPFPARARATLMGEEDRPAVSGPESFVMPESPPPLPYRIAPEEPAHAPAVEALIAESFGPERAKRTVYRFRDGRSPIAALAFVGLLPEGEGEAAGSERLVASLNFWEVAAPGGPLPLLGPLAVLSDLRGRGVGRALVVHGLAAARDQGWPAVLIVGDPGYYAPFGFSVGPVAGLDLPGPVGPLTFMGLEFTPGALSGRAGAVVPPPALRRGGGAGGGIGGRRCANRLRAGGRFRISGASAPPIQVDPNAGVVQW